MKINPVVTMFTINKLVYDETRLGVMNFRTGPGEKEESIASCGLYTSCSFT